LNVCWFPAALNCRYAGVGEEMEITSFDEFPAGSDAVIRIYTRAACGHEMRLTVWAADLAA
jgi:hypothetical protein